MQFRNLSIGALLALLAATGLAAPAPGSEVAREADPVMARDADTMVAREPAPEEDVDFDEAPEALEKRGFGCPGKESKCHKHCKSIKGYKGGYCDGPYIPFVGRPRCKCY